MSSFSDRLKEERLRLDMFQPDFGAAGGVGKQSQINYESGKRLPDADYLAKISSLGADVQYILTGIRTSPSMRIIESVKDTHGDIIEMANRVAAMSKAAIHAVSADAEFAPIPIFDAALAAGTGCENPSEEVIGQLAFRRDWLQEAGISASASVLVRAHGDSMAPSIQSGDMLLIDTAHREIPVYRRANKDTRPAPIYAVLDDGHARVKRVERPEPDLIILQSDNPAFASEIFTGAKIETLNVIGKVVWWGHTVRD